MPLGRQVYLVVCWFCFVLFCFPICYQICPEKSFELLKNETEYTTIYFTEFGVQQLTYEIICSVKGMHPSCLKRGIRDRGYTGSVWEGVNFLHSSMYSAVLCSCSKNRTGTKPIFGKFLSSGGTESRLTLQHAPKAKSLRVGKMWGGATDRVPGPNKRRGYSTPWNVMLINKSPRTFAKNNESSWATAVCTQELFPKTWLNIAGGNETK